KGQRLGERRFLFPRYPLERRKRGTSFPGLECREIPKRMLTAEHLLDHAGEGINVIALVCLLPLEHLAAGVCRGERARSQAVPQERTARYAGDPKVQNL